MKILNIIRLWIWDLRRIWWFKFLTILEMAARHFHKRKDVIGWIGRVLAFTQLFDMLTGSHRADFHGQKPVGMLQWICCNKDTESWRGDVPHTANATLNQFMRLSS